MVDDAPPPASDRLIDRLAALGPVLDDLYDEAAASSGAPPPASGGPGLRRSPRSRAGKPRRRALIAAVVLLVLVAGTAVLTIGRTDQTITTDQTTTTTAFEPSAELAALVTERVDGMETCGPPPTEADWPRPWPQGFELVNAPNCDTGWIEADAEAVRPIPVYLDGSVRSEQVAWWSSSTGWITLEEYDDPAFDLGEYRAAYQAELASRGESGGN